MATGPAEGPGRRGGGGRKVVDYQTEMAVAQAGLSQA